MPLWVASEWASLLDTPEGAEPPESWRVARKDLLAAAIEAEKEGDQYRFGGMTAVRARWMEQAVRAVPGDLVAVAVDRRSGTVMVSTAAYCALIAMREDRAWREVAA